MGDQDKESTSRGLTRRDALKLGGALAWAVPLVQTVDIRAAEAQVGSPPPEPIEPTYEGPGVGGTRGVVAAGRRPRRSTFLMSPLRRTRFT